MGLRCASCGYENDPTRVYCHNCGSKLDRAAEAPPPPSGFTHPTDVAKMKQNRRSFAPVRLFGFFLKIAIVAALIAGVVAALLPPAAVPPPVASDDRLAGRLSALVADASGAPSPRSFAVPAADVARWFTTVVRFEKPENAWAPEPKRVYLAQGNGRIRVGIQASYFGVFDLYFEGDYEPLKDGAVYTLRPVRYSVGRLPVPPLVAWPVERQFDALARSLAQPLSQLSKASRISLEPQAVTLRWSGTSGR